MASPRSLKLFHKDPTQWSLSGVTETCVLGHPDHFTAGRQQELDKKREIGTLWKGRGDSLTCVTLLDS